MKVFGARSAQPKKLSVSSCPLCLRGKFLFSVSGSLCLCVSVFQTFLVGLNFPVFLGAGLVEGALVGEGDFGLPGDADQAQVLAIVDDRQRHPLR